MEEGLARAVDRADAIQREDAKTDSWCCSWVEDPWSGRNCSGKLLISEIPAGQGPTTKAGRCLFRDGSWMDMINLVK